MLRKLSRRADLELHALMGVTALSAVFSVFVQTSTHLVVLQLTQAVLAWVMAFMYGRPLFQEALKYVRAERLSRAVLILLGVGSGLLLSTMFVRTSGGTYFVTTALTLYLVIISQRFVSTDVIPEKFYTIFLRIALGLALVAFVIWAFIFGSLGDGIRASAGVLMSACPVTVTLLRSRIEGILSYFYASIGMFVAALGLFQPVVASFLLLLIVMTIGVHRLWSRNLLG